MIPLWNPWTWLIGVLTAAALFWGGYWYGWEYRDKSCDSAALQAKLTTALQDRDTWRNSALDAARRNQTLEAEAKRLDEENDEYERTINQADTCRATDADARGLRLSK